jgi:4-hydroxyproline epimerase
MSADPPLPAIDVAACEFPDTILVVDSHTEGEPTRVVIEGWPQPQGATMERRRDDLRQRFDHLRAALVREPRGHDAIVGALLTEPVSDDAVAGVVFFNNVGYLGMCGHGLIGVVRTLQHLGRLAPGTAVFDTPVGSVSTQLDDDGAVTLRNVRSYTAALDVEIEVEGVGAVRGDIAYGGNWFFITSLPRPELRAGNVPELLHATRAVRRALAAAGVTGDDGAEIDHIELTADATRRGVHARNFVLCPGGEYDRSPCGTGTSAKLASLHARGLLSPGTVWRQESVTGGVFDAWYVEAERGVLPYIRGRAHLTGETVLRFDSADPFRAGLPAQ